MMFIIFLFDMADSIHIRWSRVEVPFAIMLVANPGLHQFSMPKHKTTDTLYITIPRIHLGEEDTRLH